MCYFACWSSRPAVVRIFRILSQLLPMDQQQVLPPLLPLGCQKTNFSSTWLLDPVNLGFCGLISCNWAGLCWSPRTSIWIAPWTHCAIGLGLVRWDGLVQHNFYIRTVGTVDFRPIWCAGHLQVVAPKKRFTLTRFVCCQPHVSEVAKTQPLREAEFLKPARSKHQLETWGSHGPSLWIILEQTYRSNLPKRGFNSKPC